MKFELETDGLVVVCLITIVAICCWTAVRMH